MRAVFGVPEHAAAQLRAVVPERSLAAFDLHTLERVEASFVDEALRSTAADLLYRVQLRDGRLAFVYFLIEHQSSYDSRLPLRLLGYLTRLWERHAREQPSDSKLPPIVPIVIHHGPRPWAGPRRFAAAMVDPTAASDAVAALPLDFGFYLDDLALLDDAALLTRGQDAIAKLAWLALRNGRVSPRFFELMLDAIRHLAADLRGPDAVPALAALAGYVCRWSDTPITVIKPAMAAALPVTSRSTFMNAIDQWRAEGRAEGRAVGRTEGEREARRDSLLTILEARFVTIDAADRARIAEASCETLARWVRRAVVAPSIAAVFAE